MSENNVMAEPFIKVENLSKFFELNRKQTLKAVNDISFEIYRFNFYIFFVEIKINNTII